MITITMLGLFNVILIAGCLRNPQTESLLQFLELPYLLDKTSESRELPLSPTSSIPRGKYSQPMLLMYTTPSHLYRLAQCRL